MSNIPFCLTPSRIYNYSSFKANLKYLLLQNADKPRSSKYIEEVMNINMLNNTIASTRDYIRTDTPVFDVDSFISMFQEKEILKKEAEIDKYIFSFFDKRVSENFNLAKEERRNNICINEKMKFQPMSGFNLINPESKYFSSKILFDCYEFLSSSNTSKVYLEKKYGSYVKQFVKENRGKLCKDYITEFVSMKYGNDFNSLDSCGGRYLYAELYVYVRSGDFDAAENLLSDFFVFFNQSCNGFKEVMLDYLEKKVDLRQANLVLKRNNSCDIFLRILLKIACGQNLDGNENIITTLEDYLWVLLSKNKNIPQKDEIYDMFKYYKNEDGRLFAFILFGLYDKTVEVLYQGNFYIYECYFIMKSLVEKSKNDKIAKHFINLTFIIIKNCLKTIKEKMQAIKSIKKTVNDNIYYLEVSKFIIKNEMYEILENPEIEYQIIKTVSDILLKSKNNTFLLKFHHLFSNNIILDVLIDELILCMVEGKYGVFKMTNDILIKTYENDRTVSTLIKLIEFAESESIDSLIKTFLYEKDPDIKILERIKPVIKALANKICRVLVKNNDKMTAKEFLEVAGSLGICEKYLGAIKKEMFSLV